MAEYIEREALLEAISKVGGSPLSEWDTAGVVSLVANQPAADVAPVARGHWVRDRDTIKCSECGFGMFPIRPAFRDGDCIPYSGVPNHCPDCGVRMEVEPHEQPESHY